MATHASALKRHRQSTRRRARNQQRLSAVKTVIKKAATGSTKDDVLNSFNTAMSTLDKAKSKGILHPNTARRKISRLAKRANAQLATLS